MNILDWPFRSFAASVILLSQLGFVFASEVDIKDLRKELEALQVQLAVLN